MSDNGGPEQESSAAAPDDLGRAIEAALFAAEEPMTAEALASFLNDAPLGDVRSELQELSEHYALRGVHLVERGKRWHFETAADLAHILRREREQVRRLSRAATEVLAIIAYHEPVSRAEIEAIRGVQTSGGTLDVLMEAGWVKIAGRREVPGRPTIYATTAEFLDHFGLASRKDLPGIAELRATGLLDPVDDAYEMLIGDDQADDPDGDETASDETDAENDDEDHAETDAETDTDLG
jgi:segregation and condensation protein B